MQPSAAVLLAATAVSAVAFVVMRRRAGVPPAAVAPARGSAAAGVLYAFTAGFAPWAKESASRHLPSYVAGITVHLALFVMAARLVASLAAVTIAPAANTAAAIAFSAGLVCGVALLAKRCLDPRVRAISVPDDFVANVLVDVALAAAIGASLRPSLLPAFQVAAAVLVLYAPLGKLRHMVFLFASRRLVGAFYGRRGVRPAAAPPGGTRG